jgi:small-conductance mechanosensitive channel
MWDWIGNNSVWILIISAAVVLLLLFLHDRIIGWFSRAPAKPEPSKQPPPGRGLGTALWVVQGIAIVIVILAFIAMTTTGTGATITKDMVEQWLVDHGVRIAIIVVVGVILWYVVKRVVPLFVYRFIAKPQRGESREGVKRRADTLKGVFVGLGRVIIIIMVVFMILAEINISIGPVLAGLGIVGVAVGFGAQYLIRDLIAGVFILMENQYRVGDVARVADVAGLVEEINLRKTVLRDLDGIVHHVPNGEIRVASNFSRHFSSINLNISVSYGTDLDHAIAVINRVCKQMAAEERWSKVIKTVPQVLRVDNLGDSGIDIKITGNVKPLEQWNVTGELRLRLKKEFDKEGIEIPWPHMKVYFGNKPE